MRLTDLARVTLAATILLAAAGCQNSTARATDKTGAVAQPVRAVTTDSAGPAETPASAQDAQPAAAGQPVQVKGYINVSSGCQQKTVDLLEKYAKEHEAIKLELIDFGTAEGSKRWHGDGYSCMTILINGQGTVTFGPKGDRRIVTLEYPPGFKWALKDLEACLKGALDGTLYIGKEPGATPVEAPSATLRITSREATIEGKQVGEVLINGKVAIRFRTTHEDLPPLQRAERAAARLKRGVAAGFTPAMIRVVDREGQVLLAISDKVVCTADGAQAKAQGTTPKALAQSWAASLKKYLSAAMSGG